MTPSTLIAVDKAKFTEAAVAQFLGSYPNLRHDDSGFDASALDVLDLDHLKTDLQFFTRHPDIALENICCRLDNYHPNNTSQERLLHLGTKLAALNDPSKPAGLLAYGAPGVGKTHIAIALAKDAMRRDMDSHYILGENLSQVKSLGANQTWVIDDLNKADGYIGQQFASIVLNAFTRGGRVFVTSNQSYESILNQMFPSYLPSNAPDRVRYMDRTKNMFAVLNVEGESQRKTTSWLED